MAYKVLHDPSPPLQSTSSHYPSQALWKIVQPHWPSFNSLNIPISFLCRAFTQTIPFAWNTFLPTSYIVRFQISSRALLWLKRVLVTSWFFSPTVLIKIYNYTCTCLISVTVTRLEAPWDRDHVCCVHLCIARPRRSARHIAGTQ